MTPSIESIEMVKCLICGAGDFLDFPAGDKNLNLLPPLKVVRCAKCGLLLLNPRPSLHARLEIFAGRKPLGLEAYVESMANYGAVTRSRASLFASRVDDLKRTFFPQGSIRVLDIGSSSGEFMEAAANVGWDVSGVEPSSDGVKKTQEKGLDVRQSPAEQLPFEDNSFDLVHSNHVFEHLADPLLAAKEAYRVTKRGGIVFIEVPNQFDNIQFLRYRLFGIVPVRTRGIRSIHHLTFFSKNSLKRLLEEARFKNIVIRSEYGRYRHGIGAFGSFIVRAIGRMYLGGPIIQAIAVKPK